MQEPVIEKANEKAASKTVTVKVNNQPVTFQDHKATGLEIKHTAIQQGVHIELNFNLFRVKGGGQLDPIKDNDTVTLHPNEEFRATTADDDS